MAKVEEIVDPVGVDADGTIGRRRSLDCCRAGDCDGGGRSVGSWIGGDVAHILSDRSPASLVM